MRKLQLAIPTVALIALSAAAVAPSYAQGPTPVTTIEVKPKVSPSKAGTKKKPQTVKLSVTGSVTTSGEDGENKPIVTKVVIKFPKGSLYNGAKAPKCSEAAINSGLPKSKCPPKSIMGSGGATAWADTVSTTADFTLVNGGANKAYLYTTMTNPAVVQTPVPLDIKKSTGKWAYIATATVPQKLQVVGGVPISLRTMKISTNANAQKTNWLQTTSCPKDKKWPFEVTSSQNTTADATFASTVPCK